MYQYLYWYESCGFPEVALAVLLQAVDMESVVVNTMNTCLLVCGQSWVGAGIVQSTLQCHVLPPFSSTCPL